MSHFMLLMNWHNMRYITLLSPLYYLRRLIQAGSRGTFTPKRSIPNSPQNHRPLLESDQWNKDRDLLEKLVM